MRRNSMRKFQEVFEPVKFRSVLRREDIQFINVLYGYIELFMRHRYKPALKYINKGIQLEERYENSTYIERFKAAKDFFTTKSKREQRAKEIEFKKKFRFIPASARESFDPIYHCDDYFSKHDPRFLCECGKHYIESDYIY
jgi:hypothetical protein